MLAKLRESSDEEFKFQELRGEVSAARRGGCMSLLNVDQGGYQRMSTVARRRVERPRLRLGLATSLRNMLRRIACLL